MRQGIHIYEFRSRDGECTRRLHLYYAYKAEHEQLAHSLSLSLSLSTFFLMFEGDTITLTRLYDIRLLDSAFLDTVTNIFTTS